jgi:outer membrane protein OmpA-like peptidoglycan-associated protein
MVLNMACLKVLSISFFTCVWCAEQDSAPQLSPVITLKATRGLTQIASAETMGDGRLTVGLTGSWYKQDIAFTQVPSMGTDVMTGVTAFSFGVNSHVDVFGWIAGYGLFGGSSEIGLGSVSGGIQGTLPLPNASPLHLGAQMNIIGGTSSNQINRNGADGYDYFETRNGYDFMGKLMQTLTFGSDSLGVKIHLNEGGVMSLQENHDMLLLLGGGIQGSIHPMVIVGLEANLRTSLSYLDLKYDPVWVTPSIQIRTPYFFNVLFGSDISIANDRSGADVRALEPYRLFGGLLFSMDFLASKRAVAREKVLRDSLDKLAMAASTKAAEERSNRSDSLARSSARKAYEDSLNMVKAAEARDAERARADSLAQKALQDSIMLAETRKKLDEEKSKRSDAEKQLLSTGLLLLDAVYFETGKTEISINSFPYLNIIGKMLTKYPKLQIEISGHTDNIGKIQSNLFLSQARADAVRLYLIQIEPGLSRNISARGYGSSQPKADNSTADGRKNNRRVELQVLNKEALKGYNQ